MSIISGFYNSYRSLMINQAALSVVNNNISNINTEGYSKQSIALSSLSNATDGNNLIQTASSGLGASIDAISRNRDTYLDSYYRNENAKTSYFNELISNTQLVENSTNELNNTGLMESLNQFYQAAQSMSLHPTDMVTRTDFVSKAIDVINQFSNLTTQLNDLRTSLVGDVSDPNTLDTSKINFYCNALNDKLAQVADLNQSIAVASSEGQAPNSLLDERDKLLDDISAYAPIKVKNTANNLVSVYVGDIEVVKGADLKGKFDVIQNTASDPALVRIVDPFDNTQVKVSDAKSIIDSGKIGAMLSIGGSDSSEFNIKNIIDKLDTLAGSFVGQVNASQLYTFDGTDDGTTSYASACLDSSTNPATLKQATKPIFVDGNGNTILINDDGTLNLVDSSGNPVDSTLGIHSSDIHVNQSIIDNPTEIATAVAEVDPVGLTLDPVEWNLLDKSQVGDNQTALKFSQMRDDSTIPGLSNSTTENFITSMIGNIGIKSSGIQRSLDTQTAILNQVNTKRESATGVNLDEELMDLTRFQRSYEASARVFNVTNEILQAIIKLGE